MTRRCEVCKLDLQDEYTLKSHIAGKKHKRNAYIFQKKQIAFNASIFVTNFPTCSLERELFQFFSQFGTIVKFCLNPKHLIIDFQTKYANLCLKYK